LTFLKLNDINILEIYVFVNGYEAYYKKINISPFIYQKNKKVNFQEKHLLILYG